MKYILLAILSLSMIGTPINGQKPFFSERTKMVAGGAFMSSLMSVVPFVIGGIIYQECAGSRKGPFKLEFTIDSMPKIKALAATLVGGAIIGGYLTYKTEKEFEANKFQHLMNAQERFAAYKNRVLPSRFKKFT